MLTFQLHSKTLDSEVQLTYDNNGRIKGILLLAETITVDESTRVNWFATVPSTVGQMKAVALKNKLVITEIKTDISFEAFWKQYEDKLGSKKKARTSWEKLNEKNKNLALNYIKKYTQSLGTTAKAHALTYLNGEYWDR